MKNGIIRIVMLTALIAVTLIGMTNSSTVLGASKPPYVVTVHAACSYITGIVHTRAHAGLTFWGGPKSDVWLGAQDVSCADDQSIDATLEFSQQPNRWGGTLTIRDYDTEAIVCSTTLMSTDFPGYLGINCLSPYDPWWPNPLPPYPYFHSAGVEISEPTH